MLKNAAIGTKHAVQEWVRMRLVFLSVFSTLFCLHMVTGPVGFSQAKSDSTLRNELGFTILRLERNSETINHSSHFKALTGMYFIRSFGKGFGWEMKAEYGDNTVDDDCQGCADHFSGPGVMTEINVASGVRKTFFEGKWSRLKPFIQLNVNASRIRYSGNFSGGFTGAGLRLDHTSYYIGPELRFGLELYPNSRIPITLSHGYKLGWGTTRNNRKETSQNMQRWSATRLELRVGYLF